MGSRSIALCLGLVVAACRDPNPLFDEPTTTDTGGEVTPTTAMSMSTDTPAVTTGSEATESTSTTLASDTDTPDTEGTTSGLCGAGEILCDGATVLVCDGNGGYEVESACSVACLAGVGCTDCVPGDARCAGQAVQSCDDLGEWVDVAVCDELQGLACDPGALVCAGACAADTLERSSVGCDFYAVTLSNLHSQDPQWFGSFSVIVVNGGDEDAVVSIGRGDKMEVAEVVAAGTASTFSLPYIDELLLSGLNETGPSLVASDGAYRVRATRPVSVSQFEPLSPQNSGDASLVLPAHAWGTRHVVVSRAHFVDQDDVSLPGFYAVVAGEDATTVTLTPSSTSTSVAAGAGVDGLGAGVVVLGAGDVLEVFTKFDANTKPDLTGTIVDADKPVAVYSGHKSVEVPDGAPSRDHLEESVPPISALGKEYVIASAANQQGGTLKQRVRVVAVEDGTSVVYEPDVPAPAILDAGEWAEVTASDLRISASKRILVAQFFEGENLAQVDPSLLVAPPVEQFREQYSLYASPAFALAGATVIAPEDAEVTLDGEEITGWLPHTAPGWQVARLKLFGADDGCYAFVGDLPFGVTVHGTDLDTSYWYPGGLGLKALP